MSLRRILNVVGLLQIFTGLSMLVAGGVSLFYMDGDTLGIFLAAALTIAFGLVSFRFTKFKGEITSREGFAIVTFAWAGAALFGALPYLFSGTVDRFVPAFFESMSGFTTTGATIFTEIEDLPHGILFWRSFTHWLGGMGIIVLAIAILPYLGVGGMQLFKAEVPGPTPERLRPRITQTAKLLWYVYLGLTIVETALLMFGGLDLFDASTHTFATLATGGFSTKNASIAGFESPYIHYVIITFMYLAGINFALHFRAVTGHLDYFKDHEWRFFTTLLLGATLTLTTLNLLGGAYPFSGSGVEEAFRDGLFQSVAIGTTTGFVTADYELWVPAAQMVIFLLFFTGGMAGSTGGSMKSVRVLLLLKQTAMELRKHLHPRAVLLARVGRRAVKQDVLANVLGFVLLYGLLWVAGAMVLALLDLDFLTSLGASAATVGNIGPGLGGVGPTDNYGWISEPALGVMSFLMLVGRLEIYTVLLLFHPETWKGR
ncbi:MAG: potassium transporter TrkG [Gemmatimonadota bacterium]|jgi:trk system potassium uptake protein TrkH